MGDCSVHGGAKLPNGLILIGFVRSGGTTDDDDHPAGLQGTDGRDFNYRIANQRQILAIGFKNEERSIKIEG